MKFPALFALVLTSVLPVAQAADLAQSDIAVYRAVLAAKIQPQVDRMSAGVGIKSPVQILVFDRTLTICRAPGDYAGPMGCMADERVVQVLEKPVGKRRQALFEDEVRVDTRRELAAAFRLRNAVSRSVSATSLDRVIAVPPEEHDEAMKRESQRTAGISSFALPAYSKDGHAVVYASYDCGGACGYGWLFLLKERGTVWQVVKTELLWIS